ncbi:MAG: OmpA family protein [Deltaproteobacteria bacterium]|nr:OmpA family protein [Deltaproteobacteria bacterium]
MRRALSIASALAVLCAAGALLAEEQVISVHLNDKVVPGRKPSLVVTVRVDLRSLGVKLRRDDGKQVQLTKQNVPRNSERTFELPQKAGRHRWRGSLEAVFVSGESGSMSLDFTTQQVDSMGLAVDYADLDLEAHALLLRAKRPVSRVDYTIVAESGETVGEGRYEPEQAGTRIELGWEQSEGKVLKIRLVAHDEEGFSQDLELFPWRWSIPHEEVVFETGKWVIRDSESPKLDRSYTLIQQGLDKYGKMLPIKLYIAGHTDTVAGADYNLGLSDKRALAIARYFRKKGFRHSIFYQGFGEKVLKVQTPDETDELQNRRAEYVLAAHPPPMPQSTAWKQLR